MLRSLCGLPAPLYPQFRDAIGCRSSAVEPGFISRPFSRGWERPRRAGGRAGGTAGRRIGTKPTGEPRAGLSEGGGILARPTVVAGDDRAGQNPHPPVRQTANDMVPPATGVEVD